MDYLHYKNLPDTYKGYPTTGLLKVWEEIKNGGTKAPIEKIEAMDDLLREYRMGVHEFEDLIKARRHEPSATQCK